MELWVETNLHRHGLILSVFNCWWRIGQSFIFSLLQAYVENEQSGGIFHSIYFNFFVCACMCGSSNKQIHKIHPLDWHLWSWNFVGRVGLLCFIWIYLPLQLNSLIWIFRRIVWVIQRPSFKGNSHKICMQNMPMLSQAGNFTCKNMLL